MTELQFIVLKIIKARMQFPTFKKEILKVQNQYHELKVTYKKTKIDPWLSCPLENCQHLTIIDLFEKEGIEYWTPSNASATQHPYWKRLKKYNEGDGYIQQKIQRYYQMYLTIKNLDFDEDLINSHPPFLCDLEGISSEGYYRQDGHHRSDIAKFLKVKIPATVAKFKIL